MCICCFLKVILKEREEKKRMRLLAETGMETPASVEGLESMEDSETPDVPPTSENEFSQDGEFYEILIWKWFLHYWPFVRETTS